MNLLYLTETKKKQYIEEINSMDVKIDKDIESFIETINKFPFVCTTQCCQGHPNNGYLSIMISQKYTQWFEDTIIPCLILKCIDIVKKFEYVGSDIILVRYLFWFTKLERDKFFEILIKCFEDKVGQY